MQKWKYGNYQFAINPNSQSSKVDMVGDNVRTLSGALISQPTSFEESYDISSVFYQQRSRSLSKISLSNASGIEYYNNQFYVLNKTNDRIDIYNKNFTFVSSVSLSAVTNKSYSAFDVASDGFYIVSSTGTTTDMFYKINLTTGALISNTSLTKPSSDDATGIRYMNGYVWILRLDGTLEKYFTNMTKSLTIILPSGLSYYGLTSDSTYLIIGNNDSYSKIYHIETSAGKIINQISFDDIVSIKDIGYDGSYFYALNSSNQLQTIKGNTVEIDILNLKNEVLTKTYVDIIDDMGVITRVSTSSFSATRKLGYDHYYDVSMTISKVNRGL